MARNLINSDSIQLRPEQLAAIELTYKFWQQEKDPSNRKFLWNAKPRFGKTLSAYFLAQKIAARRVLIVTNRPAVFDSWVHEFFQYSQLNSRYIFVSQRSMNFKVNDRVHHIYSREELIKQNLTDRPFIFFTSLQNLKGKQGCEYKDSNRWIFEIDAPWDMLIIDESHEGVKTRLMDEIIRKLQVDFTLYLSGTPFRALADRDFAANQIYNWTYLDEQESKIKYNGHDNPYSMLPRLNFHLIQSENLPSFNIASSELFAVQKHKFMHDAEINIVLDKIIHIFRTAHSPIEHRHSLWLLSNVEECQLLKDLLINHPDFSEYKIVVAVGKNNSRATQNSSLAKTRKAIGEYPLKTRTITLSCKQLTTGVTVPEWSTVVMLHSPEAIQKSSSTQYLQSAFRTQNPWSDSTCSKNDCFVIDFSPIRASTILKDYSENLCTKTMTGSISKYKLIDYLRIYLHENDNVKLLDKAEFERFVNKLIGCEIIKDKFINLNRLFNFSYLQNISEDTLRTISCLNEIYKQRVRKNPHITPNSREYSHRDITTLNGAENLPTDRSLSPLSLHSKQIQNRLSTITSAIPLLLHYMIEPDLTFGNLLDRITDDALVYFLKITRQDFQNLCQTGVLNCENLSSAINEFVKREHTASHFFRDQTPSNIFNHIAAIDSSEKYTPSQTAELIIKRSDRSGIFCSATTTVLDPYAKSGNILAVAASNLYKNLRPRFKSDHDCLLHILSKQIYAWSPNQFLRQLTLNTLLGAHIFRDVVFTDSELSAIKKNFIVYEPLKDSRYIGGDNMKFNVILSNPPYQVKRHQIYADFYRLCVELNPDILCMIFPMGWQKPQNHNGLGQLNNEKYKRDVHLVSIDNYNEADSKMLFPYASTGGVNIVLRDIAHNNHGKIRKLVAGRPAGNIVLPILPSEIEKPSELKSLVSLVELEPKLSVLGSPRNPYGFKADALQNSSKYRLSACRERIKKDDLRLFGLMRDGARGYKFIPKNSLHKANQNLDYFKVFAPKAWGNMSEHIGLGGSYANICVAGPNDCCTETFIEFGPFKTRAEATKMAKYFMTKFFRALLFLAKESQNTARDKYKYIPLPDLSDKIFESSIAEIDEHYFTKYNLPPEMRQFIRKNIQTRNESNIEIL